MKEEATSTSRTTTSSKRSARPQLLVGGYLIVVIAAAVIATPVSANFFKPFNVTYDHRALVVDGQRRMLISAGIHYPRATPEMWPDLIEKSKRGGVDVIQTYVFWNGHEPIRGQYNFDGRYDIVKFVKLVAASGLYLHLRIGPYVCAEWNFGGFPVWLRDIPGIEFRTDNAPFKEEMERFVRKIVDLMREEMLLSWQGGPIILMQIENEYGDVEGSYGKGGKEYVNWAANMALGLGAGVPWVMCKQTDAPEDIIDACNGYYCDGFRPNSPNKPVFWTENWDGWYTTWGGRLPHRPVEDLAFAVARFYQRGGSFQNYYMYFGGTNFGRTSGGPFYVTSYDYDAPIDEYGKEKLLELKKSALISQNFVAYKMCFLVASFLVLAVGLLSEPKWGHLKILHEAIKLCEAALVAVDSPLYIKLGPKQEAHIYNASDGRCSAFLANIDERNAAILTFSGRRYTLPPWSVSVLPDCGNVVFNTAKVSALTSVKPAKPSIPLALFTSNLQQLKQESSSALSTTWMTLLEPIEIWSKQNFTAKGLMEHLKVTRDQSDYLWYFTRIHVSDDDIAFWEENNVRPTVMMDSMRDVLHLFINGHLAGSIIGRWVKVVQPVEFQKGFNDLVLLSETVGLQNYGAFLERDGGGFRGSTTLNGFKDGDVDLSTLPWTYQVGLKGEALKIYSPDHTDMAEWTNLSLDALPSTFTWYKTYFDSPMGVEPVALDLGSMGKGQAWVNGHHIGRYWTLVAPKDGCQSCDYRGPYNSEKCTTNCGEPTQTWYHVPRSWLNASNNLLVILEETGGNPFLISLKLRTIGVICAHVSESHYPPIRTWSHLHAFNRSVLRRKATPELHLQCQEGDVISSIEFASYGTPKGSCQRFSRGKCHAPNSSTVVSKACQGRNECRIPISSAQFGVDPCRGTIKSLAIEAKCLSSSYTSVAQY